MRPPAPSPPPSMAPSRSDRESPTATAEPASRPAASTAPENTASAAGAHLSAARACESDGRGSPKQYLRWTRQAPPVMEQLAPCDIVMKGGITSGVVYPLAAVELSKNFRFVNIGGTSAGAIAAAAVAAAELGRATGRGPGFERLAALPAQLQVQLSGLFQPQPATRPVYRLVVGGLGKRGARRVVVTLASLLRNFPVGAIVGAIPGILLALVAAFAPGRLGAAAMAQPGLRCRPGRDRIAARKRHRHRRPLRPIRAGQLLRPLLRHAQRPRVGGSPDPVAGRPAR